MCPKCGVTSLEGAEFCMSCGQSLKSKVSSVPPAQFGRSSRPAAATQPEKVVPAPAQRSSSSPPGRNSRIPASEVNVNGVVVEKTRETLTPGTKSQKSVRYHTISSTPSPSSTPRPSSTPASFRESHPSPSVSDIPSSRTTTPEFGDGETILVHETPSSGVAKQRSSSIPLVLPAEPKVVEKELEAGDKLQVIRPFRAGSLADRSDLLKHQRSNPTTMEVPSLGIQHIWYKITETLNWNTVAVIPASESMCVIDIAHGLGMMAVREPCDFVRVVNSSLAFSKNCEEGKENDSDEAVYPYEYMNVVKQLEPNAHSASVTQVTKELLSQFNVALRTGALAQGKVFVAIDYLVSHPDAIALSRAVDKLIICVRLGETKFDSVRKIIDAVGGRERILGCVSIKPGQ